MQVNFTIKYSQSHHHDNNRSSARDEPQTRNICPKHSNVALSVTGSLEQSTAEQSLLVAIEWWTLHVLVNDLLLKLNQN